MKTGILSMHRVYNYGSFWQAYCLKKMIESCGSEAEFIDIKNGKQFLENSGHKSRLSFSKIKRIPYYIFQKKKANMFQKIQYEKLGCSEKRNYSTDYDCIIIGSDEVFNCIQQSPWGFTSQLYGDIDNNNVNSYAGSFGYTKISDLEKYGLKDEIRNAFSNLNNISVRDKNSYDIASELTEGKKILRHLDPVLIGDLPIPAQENVINKYILVYAYDFRFNDTEYIKEIKKFAKEKHLKIYSVGFYQDWVDKNIVTDPYKLLSYFKNAEYIITDTFHGTIFSVRCKKQFVTVVRDTNIQKLTSLLDDVGLNQRIVRDSKDLIGVLVQKPDYDVTFNTLGKERAKTENYLKLCLSSESL